MKTILLAIVSISIFAACTGSKKLAAGADDYSLKGDWQLISIEGQSSEHISPRKKPLIRFDESENRITGNTGCNSFSGPLKLFGDSIDLKQPFLMTKMFCEGVDETRFMNTLERGTSVHLPRENILQIRKGDSVLMEFNRVIK